MGDTIMDTMGMQIIITVLFMSVLMLLVSQVFFKKYFLLAFSFVFWDLSSSHVSSQADHIKTMAIEEK